MTSPTARFDIHTVLEKALHDTDFGLPVAYPNTEFDVDVDGKDGFIRPTLLPAETLPSTIGAGGFDQHSGFYQLDIFTRLGVGRGQAEDVASRLAAVFARGAQLSYNGTTVQVVSFSSGSGSVVEGFFQLPTLVKYYAIL